MTRKSLRGTPDDERPAPYRQLYPHRDHRSQRPERIDRGQGVGRQALSALSALLNCHSGLSPDMAPRLEKAFGVRLDTLLRMQTVYDIAQARKRAPSIDVQRFEAA
jgi:addiction module HigA family antidote